MIDLKHEARNFAAMSLPESEDRDFDEDIRWAYSLYNKALQYIRKGYDDLARQNLKKAIGLDPDFCPARMLLGVCLFANGDRVGAMRMFNAIKDMQYKRLALSYYDYLTEEVEKPLSQSGTRLILKDLYKATAASRVKLSDITRPATADAAVEMKQEAGPVFSQEKPVRGTAPSRREEEKPAIPEKTPEELQREKELESLTIGELSFEDTPYIPANPEFMDGYVPPEEAPQKEEENGALEVSDELEETDDFEIPKFISEKRQTVITSRKNDGVVEEIVKQKLEEAQKAAKYSGHEKQPFAYDHVYKKKVFRTEQEEAEPEETLSARPSEEPAGAGKKDNIILSVASVLILIFIIVVSVSLMSQITENRKLRNELDDLKKLYAKTQVSPTPSLEPVYQKDNFYSEDPEHTPFSTADPTSVPESTSVPLSEGAPSALPGDH